jgi:opacity protein-like surface antigen
MPNVRLAAALAAALIAAPAAAADKRIAVLEFKSSTVQGCGSDTAVAPALAAKCQLISTLSDAARSGALAAFKQSGAKDYVVMTRESMAVMLKDMGKGVCVAEGECEVEMGRNIGADLVVSGDVATFGETYLVTIKLHETARATLLESREVEAGREIDAVRKVRAASTELVASGLGLRGVASVETSAADEARLARAALEGQASPVAAPPNAAAGAAITPPLTRSPAPTPGIRQRDETAFLARLGARVPMEKDLADDLRDLGFGTGLNLEAGLVWAFSSMVAFEGTLGYYASSATRSDTEKLSLNVITMSAALRFSPLTFGRVTPYLAGGASAHLAKLTTKVSDPVYGGAVEDTMDASPFGWDVGAGAEVAVAPKVRLGLDARYAIVNGEFESSGGYSRLEVGMNAIRASAALSYAF